MKLDRHGIRFSIWLFFFLFAIGVVLLLGILQFSLVKPYYRNNKIQVVKEVGDQIQEYVINDNGNSAAINRAFQVAVDNNVCVAMYNSAGSLIYSADSIGGSCVFHPGAETDSPVDTTDGAALRRLIDSSGGETSLNLVNEKTGQDMVIYGKRISLNLARLYLYVNSPLEPVDSIVNFFGRQYVLFTLIVIILASIVSLIISSLLSRPIVRMSTEAGKLADADYSCHFEGGGFTETAELAASLNDATQRLSKIDELRKDLIANVSHDFRSPLTSMKGYLEAMVDGTIPPQEHEKYLNIVKNETERLTKLTNNLLTLNNLNITGMNLDITDFDINTPLTSIRAYAEMIRDISGDKPEKREEHLNVIISEADYLDHLVVDMSELSKLQSGAYVLNYSNFDISAVIREVVRLFAVMIDEGHLHVHIECPQDLVVYGDKTKITEVIYNFLSNAVKHSPQGKNITIRAYMKEDEETVRVEVEDEGEGIPEDQIPLIWDRYQKSSRSFSRSMSSTGLGLSIVKAILDSHHAMYGVISEVGKGSLFWFELNNPKEELES